MRIVIATGIYPPDIGGPALYAEGVKHSLEGGGHIAPVVLFGSLKSYPTGVRHLLYAVKLYVAARKADAIVAFDTYSVGVPAAFVGSLLRIPVVVRVGGDFVWETYLERTDKLIPLPHFYADMPPLSIRERIAFRLVRFMLSRTELAFNTRWLLDIWRPVYGFALERAHIVENVIGERIASKKTDRTLLMYGRSLVLKNAPAFRRAFARARKRGLNLTLEERVVSHDKLIERISHAHAVAVPSVSDVAPNTIIDALRCGKPFLLTKYSGYAERFKEYGIIVDPLDEEDMARGMEALDNPKTYRELCARIASFKEVRTYDDVADDFLEILQGVRVRERALSEGMRVLQIGSDRSKRGVLFPGSAGFKRQEAYAHTFGALDIIGLSLRADGANPAESGALHVYPTNSFSRLLYAFDAWRIARKLPRPDVVSVQDPFEIGLIGLLLARMKRAPLHVQVHTDFLSAGYSAHSLLNRTRVLLAGFVLQRAARVRVVSDGIRESIEKRYQLRAPVSALPLYFDAERFRHIQADSALEARFSSFAPKLLYVGRLEAEKNVRLALEAFAKSAPENACFIILGSGSKRVALGDAARDLGISLRVFFEGEKTPDPYYKLADLVLLTSRYEGYPGVVAEALSAGKPVLSTDAGAAREIGAIVTSQGEFAGALKSWFQNGPRTMELRNYPYQDFDEYVRTYCADVLACTKGK